MILVCRNLSPFPRLELKKAVVEETAAKEAAQIMLTATQVEHADLE